MSKRDEYITLINELKSISPTITDEQRKGLLRRAVQEYDLTIDVAVEILGTSGLVIGDEIDYFDLLGLSISEVESLSEAEIVDRVKAAHKQLYGESLRAGGRPRADGNSESEWRTVLNQALDTFVDAEKRKAYLSRYESRVSSKSEILSDDVISAHDQSNENISELEGEYLYRRYDEMVLIPPGEFQMGSDEKISRENEKPVHTVYVDEFYIDKYPVTNEQYKRFVDANPEWNNLGLYNFQFILRNYRDYDYLKNWRKGKFPSGKDEHPVNWVSWHAAMAYAKWIGKRLPTEAEWEKAARGGLVGRMFPWENAILPESANFDRLVGETTPVGKYPANGYGVFDIIGNVSEWCLDEWNSNYYRFQQKNNPVSGGSMKRIMESTSTRKKRVIRGGSWNSQRNELRVSHRDCKPPWKTYSIVGFRCVMSDRS